jgi:hypothetical protein
MRKETKAGGGDQKPSEMKFKQGQLEARGNLIRV